MWQSTALLIRGVFSRWIQTIGGTAMALIGFVADTQRWQIDPRVLYALSGAFFLWALVKTFHDVRLERDRYSDAMKEHRDCQTIADYLTKQHEYGIHQLLHKPPKSVDELPQWNRWVENWNEGIFVEMEKLACTPQDLNHVRTISILDVTAGLSELPEVSRGMLSGAGDYMAHVNQRFARVEAEKQQAVEIPVRMHAVRLSRIADVSTKYAKRAEAITLSKATHRATG